MYGLPHAGILANKLLKERLEPYGYTEVDHTPGLIKHKNRPIWFTLTVDDFEVKYIGKEHAEHLMSVLKQWYKMEEDWEGKLYCGILLNWHYDKGYVDISMPNYVHKTLIKYDHKTPKRHQSCSYEPEPIKYGRDSQKITHEEESPTFPEKEKKNH